MIGVDNILNILKITIYTGALTGEDPLSTAIISPIGTGKTTMVKKTHREGTINKVKIREGKPNEKTIEVRGITGSVLYTTSTTPYILYTRYGQELKSGQIRHIAIGDFLNIMNLPKYLLGNVITFYNNLIEEGILSIESRDGQFLSNLPVTVGLITTIAKEDFDKRQDDWAAIGFLSRILPVSFHYSLETAKKVRQSIKNKDYLNDLQSFDIQLPRPKNIGLPSNLADLIEDVALRIKDSKDELGARRLKQLQRFCMGNALMNGRDEVSWEDIALLNDYEKYLNTKCTAEI